jgi:hypothetical protein
MDTAKLIFDEKFDIKVPTVALRSEEELRLLGGYINEGMSLEETMDSDITIAYLSIAQMAEIYKKGYGFSVPKREDAVKIYDNIMAHLNAWHKHSEYSVNPLSPPTDDLILLDEMAEKIFGYNKKELTAPVMSDFSKHVQEKFGLGNMLSPFENKKKEPDISDVTRESMGDKFKTRLSMHDIDLSHISD